MKKALIGIVVILSLAVAGGVFYWLQSQPVPKTEGELKASLPFAADNFLKCIDADQIGSCYFQMTSDDFQAATNIQKMTAITQAVKIKLGDRISGAMVQDSFTMSTVKGPKPIDSAEFTMSAIYQNDATVKENFVFVRDPRTDQYKVHTFKISSSKF